MEASVLDLVRAAAAKRILFLSVEVARIQRALAALDRETEAA